VLWALFLVLGAVAGAAASVAFGLARS